MALTVNLLAFFILLAGSFTAAVRNRQSAIISHLKGVSDPDDIPIADTNDGPVRVDINLSLIKILDVDKDRDEVEVLVWQTLSWRNPALAWDVGQDGFNETRVSLPTQYLWQPDITIYNAVTAQEVLSPHVAVVGSDGSVYHVPSTRVRFTCDLQTVDSYGGATCKLKFGSWTYSTNTVTLSNSGAGIDASEYVPNPNYSLLTTYAQKHIKEYPCCPGDWYEDIEFQFGIRKLFHAVPISEEKKRSG